MSYDAILMGLISRVQKLELQVKTLSDRLASITGETVLPAAGRPDTEYAAELQRTGEEIGAHSLRKVPTRTTPPTSGVSTTPPPSSYVRPAGKVTTMDVRDYIDFCRRYAAEHGESSVVLRSGEVHRFLRMRNSMPSVCNAMYTSMNDGDEVLDSSPSGYSSTLTIRFNVQHE